MQVHGKKLVTESSPTNKYTGEKIGIEYLYQQSGRGLLDKDISNQTDERCHVEEDKDQDIKPAGDPYFQLPTCGSDYQNSDEEDEIEVDTPEESVEESVDESVDFCGIPGWDKVDKFTHAFLNLKGLAVTTQQAVHIKQLCNNLLPYDKKPLEYKAIVKRPTRGRFARSKHRSSYVGRDAMERCFLSAGASFFTPSKSRNVEAIYIQLCESITQHIYEIDNGQRIYISRWKRVLRAYNRVRARLMNSYRLLQYTDIALFPINETTIFLWYKNKTQREEITTLMQRHKMPDQLRLSKEKLPPARDLMKDHGTLADPLVFHEPADRSRLARVNKRLPATSTITNPSRLLLPKPQEACELASCLPSP